MRNHVRYFVKVLRYLSLGHSQDHYHNLGRAAKMHYIVLSQKYTSSIEFLPSFFFFKHRNFFYFFFWGGGTLKLSISKGALVDQKLLQIVSLIHNFKINRK